MEGYHTNCTQFLRPNECHALQYSYYVYVQCGLKLIWNLSEFCHNKKLEQLEGLRSEDTPRRLMITHTIESYWIPSQKKTKSKIQT